MNHVIVPITGTLVLFISSFAVASILNPMLIVGFMSGTSLPIPRSREIEAVSGLYGPGAYVAWVLCTVSAIIGSSTQHSPSPRIRADHLASLIYSRTSTYCYYGQVLWYSPRGLDIIQDYSVQAASFVFNVSVLLNAIGFRSSPTNKQNIWLHVGIWDMWLAFFSPMTLVNVRSTWMHVFVIPLTLAATFFSLPAPFFESLSSPPFPFLPFVLLEAVRTQFFTTSPLILPRSASNFTDLDQLVSLLAAITVVVYQWGLWNLPEIARKLRTKFGRYHPREDSMIIGSRYSKDGDHLHAH